MKVLEKNGQMVTIDAGELVGYQVNAHEYIHQKGSPGWSSTDTEMFPIIGPVNEADFKVEVPNGTAFQDQHGHLRLMGYDLISSDLQSAIYKKEYTAATRIKNSKFPDRSTQEWLQWPYSFSFEKKFELHNDALEITFKIEGDADMPFMLGYHPAFKLHNEFPMVKTKDRIISLDDILAVGGRALEVANCQEITLKDKKKITLRTEGFGHFMCWTEVRNMVCIEPISFYPYAVLQSELHQGFEKVGSGKVFKVILYPEF